MWRRTEAKGKAKGGNEDAYETQRRTCDADGGRRLGRRTAPRCGPTSRRYVLGAPNSLTGGLGENGQRGVWGFLIAVDQINREGGVKALGGARLRVVAADTTSDSPTQGASVTRRVLDQDHAIALYGATASAITMAAQVEAEKSQVPIVTSSYADPLVKRGMRYTFKITAAGSVIWNFAMDSCSTC